jgi:uncharacterized protein (DUF433 family)
MSSIADHIETRSNRCGGKPCIAGTRIRVYDVYVWHELHGRTADEIVSDFPQISHADVYAALAYYWDHRDEIEAQMAADRNLADQIREQQSGSTSQ